ncbi:hypothetical protein PpBr36_04764 [Pyricularia pennisetigena]|uniref:hypothetical protein n=1 Tax=Pyricularia pennisetigena TaxID=1578925 RepID=UPI001152D544|nr:hypothetical protein PpBr36_04764 [Pyricularia pennisetigena]TLS26394.1 hypothetical protein PpBr36_04764 [Pyricularia pennisetigena]
MEHRNQNRRSSRSHLDELIDISVFFQRDKEYQIRGRTESTMASSAQQQDESRRGTETSAPGILKRQNSSDGKRRSVRFTDQEPKPDFTAGEDLGIQWLWLPEESTYTLNTPGRKWKPETWDVVDNQEMSGALPTEECRSSRNWRSSYAPLIENMRKNHRAADSHPETNFFSRKHAASRPEKKLFSQAHAATSNPVLRSPASLIDWIMQGYDDGLRSRHILEDLTDILTEEL